VRALIAAELLRLRTVRSTFPAAAGAALLITLTAVLNLRSETSSEFEHDLGGAGILIALVVATSAATTIAYDFKRGSTALTYLAEPRRHRVLRARLASYAVLGGAFAALVVLCCCLAGLAWAAHKGWQTGLTAPDVAALAAGGAGVGAAMSAVGVLVATAARNPTAAAQLVVVPFIAGGLVAHYDAARYLPFALVSALFGATDQLGVLAALALLAGYVLALYVAVSRWAVPRDIT
jgi:hypothetical protein